MATGLINLNPNHGQVATYGATQAQATKATATGYTPDAYSVDQNSTVKGQLGSLIAEDSPLLKQARQRATLKSNEEMNARGLLGSSLAIGASTEAADRALYDNAIPIATADANRYGEASFKTTDARNAAAYAKAQAENTASLTNAQLGTNVSLANADATTKADAATAGAANQFKQTGLETERAYGLSDRETARSLQLADKQYRQAMDVAGLDAQTRVTLANMDRETQTQLATINNNYRALLQTNQDASSMYNQVATNIANISQSGLSPDAKDAAIATQLNSLQEALRQQQAVLGSPATQGTSLPSSPNIAALNLGNFFSGKVVSGGNGSAGTQVEAANAPARIIPTSDGSIQYTKKPDNVSQSNPIYARTSDPPPWPGAVIRMGPVNINGRSGQFNAYW